MSKQIEQLIDEGLVHARARAGQTDVAYGVLSALKRVYGVIEEIAGPTTMPMLDGCLRNRVVLRALRLGADRAVPAEPLPLPVAGAKGVLAEAILVSAAESCLALKSIMAEDGDVFMLAFVLIDRLFEAMDGVPDAAALLIGLRDDGDMPAEGDAVAGTPAILRH
jgi:hypothetical protein